MPEKITLLGATGSIGTQSLEVLDRFPERFSVHALAAGNNVSLLAQQIRKYQPKRVCVGSVNGLEELRQQVPEYTGDMLSGDDGLISLAADPEADTLVVGLVGMRGLRPTLAALETGKKVLTANKETFVAGGHLVAPWLEKILPIDSEHSAIHQCLKNEKTSAIQKLYLTASGGPFRDFSTQSMETISVADALNHPNWVMGRKITIDSATLMNKGLEVIEAHWLFGVDYDQIQVVIHPQSIIHSGVEFTDGSILAQMGAPDMRVPLQYALGYPERLNAEFPGSRLDLLALSQLDFQPPDENRFPCLRLAYEAGRMGSGATAVLNAADEVAVQLFLEEQIGFTQISRLLENTLEAYRNQGVNHHPTLNDILELDAWARRIVVEEGSAKIRLPS